MVRHSTHKGTWLHRSASQGQSRKSHETSGAGHGYRSKGTDIEDFLELFFGGASIDMFLAIPYDSLNVGIFKVPSSVVN